MSDNYEINSETLVLIPIGDNATKVIECNREFIICKNIMKIIDNSCRFFGSSYLGRCEGSKAMIGMSYKLPIIIEETKELIFFPTVSPRTTKCIWIALSNIESYQKDENKSKIIFRNKRVVKLDVSYGSLENQIFRSTMLIMMLKKRKKQK